MGKIKNTRVLASDPETTSAPRFNFRQYRVGDVYHNDGNDIDFVTDNKSLYVCLVESVQASKENIAEQEGLLKLVSQGEQGVPGANGSNGTPGVTPRIDAHFDGKQMIVTVNGAIKAVSPDLGGPSWKPVVDGTTLSWELTTDKYSPAPIDLTTLRPISEHPILLRTNSDNTKYDWETSGPANYIQWKYEGDEYWNNLISISELMNLALAGVSFWYNEDTQEWHFGHKEVIRASYTADKNGRKIISDVELGDILFDAGAVPMPNYEFDIQEIQEGLEQIQTELENYATKDWVEGKGYLTGVDLDDYAKKSEIPGLTDAYTKAESDAKYQPKGNYLTEHQPIKNLSGQSLVGQGEIPLKTINGETIIGTGNITVSVGDANLFDLTTRTVNGTRHLIKVVNGVETDLGIFPESGSGSGTGCAKCWDEAEILALFANNTIADLRITNNVLQKKVNGQWSDVGNVGGDGGTNSFDVKIENNYLYKSTNNGVSWTQVGRVNSSEGTGTGCDECFTTSQIQQMIANALAGLDLDGIVRIADLDGYVKISDLSAYATKQYVEDRIRDIETGGDVDYYRIFTLYQRTATRQAPNLPVVGNFQWNTSTGEIVLNPIYPTNWENHPQNATTETPYLWMTSATFSYKTKSEVIPEGASTGWETPICLTGEPGSNGIAGEDGADGSGVEFIYTLIPDESYVSFVSTPVTPAGQGDDDIPSGWTDHPQGIGEYAPKDIETTVSIQDELTPMMWKVEMASVRIYDGASKTWGAYSKPFIWSMWGEDGMDGDGVEYIFCVTTQPSIATFITEIPITNEQVEALGSAYQVPDWTPYNGNWTDNPLDVDENQPYEWVAIRKYNGETGKWGPFSDPKVWGLWGQKTVYQAAESYYRPYMCYAFTRTNIDDFANQYTVVSPWEYNGVTYAQWIAEDSDRESDFYDNPLNYIVTLVRDAGGSYVDDNGRWSVDTNIEWHDSIPTGTEQLYLINNLIGDEKDEETGWNGPTKWGDQAGFQTEYAASTEETDRVFAGTKVLPSLNDFVDDSPETVDEAAWRTVARTTGCGEWRDDNQISDPVYMATAYKKANGVWSAWTVAKIKGEKGNDGTNGTDGADGAGVEFVYFRTANESQVPAVSDTYGTYDKQTKVSEDPEVDDFLPLVIASGFTPEDDTLKINNELYWHDNPEGVSERFQCEWVAVRFSAVSDSGKRVWGPFSVALWSKYGVNGRDGDGIEYVFHTSTTETKPTLNNNQGKCPKRDGTGTYEISTDYANRREWLPYAASGTPSSVNDDFWTDDPSGVSPSAPYEWVAVRKYNGELKEWEQFGPVALWAKFAFDGRDSDEREFVYLIADSKPSIFGEVNATGTALVDASGQSSQTVNEVAEFNTPDYFPYAVVNGTRWNDHPEGVDEPEETEWYSYREITHTRVNGEDVVTYGNFCEPMIWSQFGKTGRDGDGVQYIFARTQNRPFGSQLVKPATWINDAGYQDKYGEYIPANTGWYDDPEQAEPNENYPFEWVSMRKWRVNSSGVGSWSAYTEPSLWACYVEDSENRTIVTLDISNSQAPFQVDENNKVVKGTDAIPLFAGTSSVLIKDDGTLLDWGKVYLGTLNNGVVTWNSTPAITISNYTAAVNSNVSVTNGSATSSIAWAYASQRRAYDFTLSTVFASNATVIETVVIPVKVEDITGAYAGVDYLYLNPVHSEKLVTLNKEVGDVIKKASAESKLYDPNTIWFAGNVENDTTYDTVSKFTYSYTIDGGARIEFDAIPTSDKNSVISTGEKYYYFDKNGNRLANANAGFATLHIYNDDDNQHEWNDWSAMMQLNLEYDNTLTAITDKLVLGVGYDGEITDEEPVYIIYPGKDGNGIDTIDHKYYYNEVSTLTNQELDALSSSSWLDQRNDAAYKGKYVYIKTITTYTDGDVMVEYSVEYVPNDGASGTAVPYMYQGEWEPDFDYYHNSQRIDIVKVTSTNNTHKYYIKTDVGVSSIDGSHTSGNDFASDLALGYWEEFQGEYENIATGFLFAETGVIQNLKVAEVATGNYPSARITINEDGAIGNGNNEILGYASNETDPGIKISGTNLTDFQYVPSGSGTGYIDDHQGGIGYRTNGNTLSVPVLENAELPTDRIGYDQFYISVPTGANVQILSGPDLGVRVYRISDNVDVTNDIDYSGGWLLWPTLTLEVIDDIDGRHRSWGSLGTYNWNAQTSEYEFVAGDPITYSSSTPLYLTVFPKSGNYEVPIIWGSVKINGTDLVISDYYFVTDSSFGSNSDFTYQYVNSNADQDSCVTIAPNGILVYFDASNYLQFIKTDSGVKASFKVNGVEQLK